MYSGSMETFLLLVGIFCLAKAQDTQITIGILDIPEAESYAREFLASCAHGNRVQVSPLSMELLEGSTVLGQAEKFKSHIEARSEKFFVMIGPLRDAIVMVTENLGIPYLAMEAGYHGDARNVYYILPGYDDVTQCVLTIMEAYKWRSVGVLWQNRGGVHVFSGFIEASEMDFRMFRIYDNSTSDDMREILRSVRSQGIRNLLLLTDARQTRNILLTGKKLGILTVPYSWLLLNHGQIEDVMDLLYDLETNITTIHVMKNWTTEALASPRLARITLLQAHAIKEAVQLVCDMAGLRDLTVYNFSNMLDTVGHQLSVEFDEQHRRTGYKWNIYSTVDYLLQKIGRWERSSGGNELIFDPPPVKTYSPHWLLKKSRVVTILEKPWVMRRNGNCTGNDCYEGFIVDMMKALAELPIFSPSIDYELYIVPDGKFGSFDFLSQQWNGIMGEIMSGDATLSLAPLSINHQREEAVDFTKPFKTRGITLLIRTPETTSSFFQFLDPLSLRVWGMILFSMLVVGFALGLYEKFGTRQRRDFQPITGQESFWFVFGTLMQEGTEVSPVTIAGRILTASWWFFAMILISSYTANLAAFLTVKKINTPIESISDLLTQSKIKYGTVRNSGVLTFFQTTQVEPYRSIGARMGPESLVDNTSEGLDRVRQGDYAFFWDNTVTSYIASTDCNFTEIGSPFDPKGFGIGVPSGAYYRENLTLAVLSLADSGILDQLLDKWWNVGECTKSSDSSNAPDETEELELENVAGIFFILVGGLVLGLIVCVLDHYTARWRRKHKEKKDDAEEKLRSIEVKDKYTQNSSSF